MKREHRHHLSIASGVVTLVVLAWLTTVASPEPNDLLTAILFCMLVVFTMTFGVPLAGGSVSLVPMVTVAACLVLGLVSAGWIAFAGAIIHGLVRHRWAKQLDWRRAPDLLGLVGVTAANASMHSVSILVGGVAFQSLGGRPALTAMTLSDVPPILVLGLTYITVNYLIAGAFFWMRGRGPLTHYIGSLPNLVFYEGAPMVFAPLLALVHNQLGLAQFVFAAMALVISSLVTRDVARSRQRLERRVKELDSLQAVGQALSASLLIKTVLSAVYTQVARLMQANNFYVALYNSEAKEVSFPLVVENGERVQWRSRRTGNGLTEHILRTCAPLLIPKDIPSVVKELGLDQIGQPAACWLGVPILAGSEPLGVIAVQSYASPGAYDTSHLEIMTTIAAQAAVAIQNARLYARTDETLARRVQELDSILRTTREGMLLLDQDWHVLAVNRALADLLGPPQTELAGHLLDAPTSGQGQPLVSMIGYTPAKLEADCQSLGSQGATLGQAIVTIGREERHIERTLAPVRDLQEAIVGWLFIFRDISEEVELARLRDELTHMLVHDLRSPLAILKGSLALIETAFADCNEEEFGLLLGMAQRNSERMLGMVNELLEISKLESGELKLHPEAVEVGTLLEDTAARHAVLAAQCQITLEIAASSDLPAVYVDLSLITRVLNNLLDNAIKFTPDGGHVRLWATLDPELSAKRVLVGMSDTGPGIPSEALPQVFEKFQQIESVRGRRAGTGLGLPFCKLVVEAHDGRIWVESEPTKGSTFLMTLPLPPKHEVRQVVDS